MLCSLLVTCLEWVGNGSKITCVMEGHPDNWRIAPNVINTYWEEIQWKKIGLSFGLKNGLRFHFDSETCSNYPFLSIFLL